MASEALLPAVIHRRRPVWAEAGLAVAVGMVLADASVVVLALPDMLTALDATVTGISWVITAFNLALALAAVPAALAARRLGPVRVEAAGLVVFAAASAAAGLAGDLGTVIAARCVQAVSGAAVVCAALELLPVVARSPERGTRLWIGAAAVGSAVGPAIGGVLTQALSWRAVFAVQVPLAAAVLVPVIAAWRVRVVPRPSTAPLRLAPNLALALVSAALTAALFLLVLMLVDGWGMDPIAAAAAVSVMPATAIIASVATRLRVRDVALSGAILVGGGLAGLALLPDSEVVWTVAPQVLIGAGLALTLGPLTTAALGGLAPDGLHGGWTVAFRHGGVVLGLLILTPLFTADLDSQEMAAERAGAAAVIDSDLSIQAKLRLGQGVADALANSGTSLPDLHPVFAAQHPSASDRPEYARLEAELTDQARRAGTHAFSRSFLVAAALALAAIIPLVYARLREEGA
ncbi:MAG TPA: MFS transporter [Gaiellales bacterium]|nr:MFS transporter [Gaiellales bacterium]